jgi:hypothetical protein
MNERRIGIIMNMDRLKKGIVSMALVGSFILGAGMVNDANAQDRRWERQRRIEQQRRGGVVESTGNIDRNKNGVDDRYETRDGRVDINQNGIADQDEGYDGRYGRDRGYYGNDRYGRDRGYYGNDGYYDRYGRNNAEFQKGYRDGLDRGRSDALTNRAMDPNNSSHYRRGNASYRAGFERGFYEAYQQYRNRRW